MKKVNIRSPDIGPLGDTFFEARLRAITAALFVKSPSGGCVESVVTPALHFFGVTDDFFWVAFFFVAI